MLRTEALTKFSGKNVHKKVLVTYPEALFERVVNPTSLNDNMIHFKVGETLQLEALLNRFVSLGFKREDFVYEPGQFALRGGILDIYSFGNEHPYRVELFDTEVDSIRIFNPETQLPHWFKSHLDQCKYFPLKWLFRKQDACMWIMLTGDLSTSGDTIVIAQNVSNILLFASKWVTEFSIRYECWVG